MTARHIARPRWPGPARPSSAASPRLPPAQPDTSSADLPSAPATVQLEGSSTLVALFLAQHVAEQTTPIAAGNNAIAIVFGRLNPVDSVIIGGY